MKSYALISDVHSNFVALEAVLNQIDVEGVDAIICAGDIVGYNSQPNQVIDEIRRRAIQCIMGNHDEAVILPVQERTMNSLAAFAVRWTKRRLTGVNTRFLESLKQTLTFDGFAVYHGSPFDPYEYIYEDQVDERLALASSSRFTVLGHTHVPFVRRLSGATVINPGSVGQPRDGDARASYAIVEGDKIEIRRVPYDIESIVRLNVSEGLPTPLSERLRWGV